MAKLIEFLAIGGFAILSFIGIQIMRGGRRSAIIISVAVSVALLLLNAKLEDETGKGIVQTVYCSVVQCVSDYEPLGPAIDPLAEQAAAEEQARIAEEARLAEEARVRAQTCIRSAMYAVDATPSDDLSIYNRMSSFDLTACPADFGSAYVGLRQSVGQALDLGYEISQHQASGESAFADGVGVSLLEWMLETDTGITPIGDWQYRDRELKARAEALQLDLRARFEEAERIAANYGVFATPAPTNTDMTSAM